MRHKDLTARSALELRRLIGRREISPVELMKACIDRIEALNPGVNAIAATDFDRSLAQAREAEAQVMRGEPLPLLHGLPIGVKDLQHTAGLLTTCGNVGLRGHVPTEDTALVARLRQAGAIVTAKTNVPDMGAGGNTRNPVWGATGNPFDNQLNAGGSSGGSAAALATDMLPLCTGSDTGGSLRIPASLCGVVGLRPSPGLIANDHRALGWSALSVLGPMARSVQDTAFFMAASVGSHPYDPISRDVSGDTYWPLPEVDLSTLRIGVVEDFGFCAVEPDIRKTFRDRVKRLTAQVHSCETIDLGLTEDAHRAFDILRSEAFLAAYGETYQTAPETLGPNVVANLEMAASFTLADIAWAHLEQTRIARHFAHALSRCDLIVAPVTPMSPFPWTQPYAERVDGRTMRNYYEWLSLTYVVTLATNPSLSLPCGVDSRGMPFGLQVIGPLRGDAALLAASMALEQAFQADAATRRPRPGIEALLKANPALTRIVTDPPLYSTGISRRR
ncbi:MAG TPA: amidase [Hydrogenophaga sp.]|nr:amidase [Hydrogenophaga sp.]